VPMTLSVDHLSPGMEWGVCLDNNELDLTFNLTVSLGEPVICP